MFSRLLVVYVLTFFNIFRPSRLQSCSLSCRAATIHRCTAIFFVTIRISIFEWDIAVSQNNKIFLIKNEKLLFNYQHSEITVSFNQFYDSLPKYRPFLATGLRRCLVYRFACFQSRIFQDGGTKACVVSISCQLTQSYVPATKTLRSLRWFFRQNVFLLQLAPSSYKLSKVWKDFGFKVFYDGQGVTHFSLYSCVIFYHLLIVINGILKIPKQFSNITSLVSCML